MVFCSTHVSAITAALNFLHSNFYQDMLKISTEMYVGQHVKHVTVVHLTNKMECVNNGSRVHNTSLKQFSSFYIWLELCTGECQMANIYTINKIIWNKRFSKWEVSSQTFNIPRAKSTWQPLKREPGWKSQWRRSHSAVGNHTADVEQAVICHQWYMLPCTAIFYLTLTACFMHLKCTSVTASTLFPILCVYQ
jgi:hypothetical protein